MKAIQVQKCGGPEELRLTEVPNPAPGAGQALVEVHATGVNFIDIYHRTGVYKVELPFIPGMEAAGVVRTLGPDVTSVKVGDRVAFCMTRGTYSELVVASAAQLVPIPGGVSFETAAAAMLQGMTAHYLGHSTFPLKPGDTALVHAAAGGTGRLLVQMARMKGARVFGTASTESKAELALSAGCEAVFLYTSQDFEAEVKRASEGRGVDVVYDSVGQDTFLKGLNCLRPRGMMVAFGQSSGLVSPFDIAVLNIKGSLYLTRPSLGHHIANRDELLWRASDLFNWISSGTLDLRIAKSYPLSEAAQSHIDLAGRRFAGKLLLLPR